MKGFTRMHIVRAHNRGANIGKNVINYPTYGMTDHDIESSEYYKKSRSMSILCLLGSIVIYGFGILIFATILGALCNGK